MSERDYNPNGLHETMARIDTNQTSLLAEFRELRADHEFDRQRINGLERWRSWSLGFSTAVSGLATAVWHWLQSTGSKPH